jgi:luciferase-like monooxygenase
VTPAKLFMRRGAALRGLTTAPSRFGSHRPALWHGTRQIAHPRREDVEIRLTRGLMRRMRDELRADLRINLRQQGSDWIIVYLRRTSDVDRAIELLRLAIRANTIRG